MLLGFILLYAYASRSNGQLIFVGMIVGGTGSYVWGL